MPEYESVVGDGVVDEASVVTRLSLEISRPEEIAEERYGTISGDNNSVGEQTSLQSGLTSLSAMDDVCKVLLNHYSLNPSRTSDVLP
jgi:hypothetical protein